MLKNKDSGDVYFVVVFALVPRELVQAEEEEEDEEGGVKGTEEEGGKGKGKGREEREGFEPKEDDLD